MAEIPKIVKQRLQAGAALRDHPEPNLLSAFVERSLGKREQVEVLEHVSQCTDCREVISWSANQPGIADAVSVARVNPSWLSWPGLRWGAAVACVVVVGAAVTLRHRPEPRFPGTIAGGKSAIETQRPMPDSVIEKTMASAQVLHSADKIAVVAKQAGKPISLDHHTTANSRPIEMAEVRPFTEIVPGRAKDALVGPQSAPAETVADEALAKTDTDEDFFPENLVPRWALGSDGTLQRSFDSGRTWETIPVSAQTIFRALSANGFDIWVGGAAGTLFHSSDAGQHWTRVRPVVNGEALAGDIIGVEFRDALHGKLTSSMQEIWITADAGETWQRQ
jgi:Photosynthesis system II assembly factor YCF48/Putative zinc-finger